MTLLAHWSAVWASVGGGLGSKLCEDACGFRVLSEAWSMGVVSDGAGSAGRGGEGARFLLEEVLAWSAFWSPEAFVDEATWLLWLEPRLEALYGALLAKAEALQTSVESLSATLILVFAHAQKGCFWWQLGDGRAACLSQTGAWSALFKPFRGEMANETLFFNRWAVWQRGQGGHYAQPIQAWTLLSDGCERAAFEVNIWREDLQRFEDPNRPFPPFFQDNLLSLKQAANQDQAIKNKFWADFLHKGNEVLSREPDDKSMILALAL